MTVRILRGDVTKRLRQLPTGSVHCVVTSPPYYALRDYGVPGQLGLEKSPDEYIRKMVKVFREVRRVLRDDGTLWLNMGDSYVSDGGPGAQGKHGARAGRSHTQRTLLKNSSIASGLKPKDLFGIPWMLAFALRADGWWLRQDIIWSKKNPMPESVDDRCTKAHEYVFLLSKSERYYYDKEAIAEPSVYADEAVYDNGENGLSSAESHAGKGSSTRKFKAPGGFPSGWDPRTEGRSHRELVGRYSPKDEERSEQGLRTAAAMGHGPGWRKAGKSGNKERKYGADRGLPMGEWGENGRHQGASVPWEGITRNKRSVWSITSKPFAEAHFATFPPELPEICIKAGTSEHGVCVTCGAPWSRTKVRAFVRQPDVSAEKGVRGAGEQKRQKRRDNDYPRGVTKVNTLGWQPTCKCAAEVTRPLVLDPFGGAGTTGLVAAALNRHAVLIELNPDYADMAARRIHGTLFAQVEAA